MLTRVNIGIYACRSEPGRGIWHLTCYVVPKGDLGSFGSIVCSHAPLTATTRVRHRAYAAMMFFSAQGWLSPFRARGRRPSAGRIAAPPVLHGPLQVPVPSMLPRRVAGPSILSRSYIDPAIRSTLISNLPIGDNQPGRLNGSCCMRSSRVAGCARSHRSSQGQEELK